MAASRSKTPSSPSSPAGDAEDGLEEDPCGYGCHAAGVPDNAVSAGCEHGTYDVTPGMRRAKPFVAPPIQTVHDRSVHFPEQAVPSTPDSGALAELLSLVNGYGERILVLEATVRQIIAAMTPPEGDDGTDPDD